MTTTSTVEQLEATQSELLGTVKSTHDAYMAKVGEYRALEAKTKSFKALDDERAAVLEDLNAAKRARDDEIGIALIEERQADTRAHSDAIRAAELRLADIATTNEAAGHALRVAGDQLDVILKECEVRRLARNDALADYLVGTAAVARERLSDAVAAHRYARAGMYAVGGLAMRLQYSVLTLDDRKVAPAGYGYTNKLMPTTKHVKNECNLAYEGDSRGFGDDQLDALFASLEAIGVAVR